MARPYLLPSDIKGEICKISFFFCNSIENNSYIHVINSINTAINDQLDRYIVKFSFVHSRFVLQLALKVFVKYDMYVKTALY
jgi:hypothetical protein